MRKYIFLIVVPFFIGCDKYVVQTNPQLQVSGRWKISSITPVFQSTITDTIKVTQNDYYAQSPFIIVSLIGNQLIIRNDTANIKPCFFYKLGYLWEFDGGYLSLFTSNNVFLKKYRIHYGDLNYNPNDFSLVDFDSGEYVPGNWHMSQNGIGVNRSNDLTITVPDIWFDITGSGRSYKRAVNQSIILNFVR